LLIFAMGTSRRLASFKPLVVAKLNLVDMTSPWTGTPPKRTGVFAARWRVDGEENAARILGCGRPRVDFGVGRVQQRQAPRSPTPLAEPFIDLITGAISPTTARH